jgi:DNA-binding NarL/FixJ family response regulator
MRQIRVLLVDDNPEFLEAAERFVATVPNVKVVGHAIAGDEALALIASLHPELVLMDYVMPDMNGIEATIRIKELSDAPFVVILTLHDIPEYHAQAEAAGADGFLPKVDLVNGFTPLVNRLFRATNKQPDLQGNGSTPSAPILS